MDDKFTNRLNMYLTVEQTVNQTANKLVWEGNPPEAFGDLFAEFRLKLAALGEIAREQETTLTGIAVQKQKDADALINSVLKLGKAMAGWLLKAGRGGEAAEVNLAPSAWKKLRDAALLNKAQLVLSRVTAVLAEAPAPGAPLLAKYNVTPAQAALLTKAVEDYGQTIVAPQVAQARRKAFTAALRPHFKEITDFLDDELDDQALQFTGTPEGDAFYAEYTASRVIRDLGKGKKKPPAPDDTTDPTDPPANP